VCLRCRRPRSVCWCALLPRLETRTHVVFLQHPRERYVAVGTARMAHLALPNSELHSGVVFGSRHEVASLAARPKAVVLFPGPGARDVGQLAPGEVETLFIVDGTWPLAHKVLKQNPFLQTLPRIQFIPRKPGNYRIRKEPAANCVSTIEAVAEVLGRLEGDPERFAQMLPAFDRMVDWQIEHRDAREGPPRRKLHKPVREPPLPRALAQNPERLVVFYAEANAYAHGSVPHHAPELVQLVAERPATGERFEALLAPRAPLAPRICEYIEVPATTLLNAPSATDAAQAWRRFLRPGDSVCGWGHFARGLALEAGFEVPSLLDLRLPVARALKQRPGDLDAAPLRLGRQAGAPWAQGRAGRRLAALNAVAIALLGFGTVEGSAQRASSVSQTGRRATLPKNGDVG
jgi:DTW domain-containing protein YfiP